MSQTAVEPTVRPTGSSVWDVVHGYPPPARPPGAVVVAYCGALTIVRGEASQAPPLDTCTDCIVVWRRRRGERAS